VPVRWKSSLEADRGGRPPKASTAARRSMLFAYRLLEGASVDRLCHWSFISKSLEVEPHRPRCYPERGAQFRLAT
jgi:hypothetical protein